MTKGLKIRSVLICDDVRHERSGKDICIGVYNGVIVIPRTPTLLPKIVIRIEIESIPTGKNLFKAEVIDPAKNPIFSAEGEIEPENSDDPVSLALAIAPMPLLSIGRYIIKFGLKDAVQTAGYFKVRTGVVPA
jgi:hypothetical protein